MKRSTKCACRSNMWSQQYIRRLLYNNISLFSSRKNCLSRTIAKESVVFRGYVHILSNLPGRDEGWWGSSCTCKTAIVLQNRKLTFIFEVPPPQGIVIPGPEQGQAVVGHLAHPVGVHYDVGRRQATVRNDRRPVEIRHSLWGRTNQASHRKRTT